jgi:uncharacterized protein YaiL (DUF2058 family)
MSDSLRDQLLGLGFKPAAKPERAPRPQGGKPAGGKPHGNHGPAERSGGAAAARAGKGGQGRPQRKPRSQGEIDLAKAYAIRAQREKEERIAAEQARQEAARLRREARAKLSAFLAGKALNQKDAEIARHFEYGGKIKRIYVTAEQLKALNAGELGVVQDNGRYLLVGAAHLAEAETIFAEAVALKVDPNAPAEDDPYADPKFQVPDDLVW